jgi:Protein of unknown function (DUF3592)
MSNDRQDERPRSERMVLALVMAVFATAFGAVALVFGALPVADAVSTARRHASLVEVPATIKDVQLERGTRRGQEHQRSLRVRYSYEWKGVTYDSTRVSVQHWAGWRDGASWHQAWYDQLEQARRSGTTVPAWVADEGSPQAVLDKELRWTRLWLAIPLLLSFGGVCLFFALQLVRLFVHPKAGQRHPSRRSGRRGAAS